VATGGNQVRSTCGPDVLIEPCPDHLGSGGTGISVRRWVSGFVEALSAEMFDEVKAVPSLTNSCPKL